MNIYKRYSVVLMHDEDEDQQIHAMACYFSNLSYNEHRGDLSGYEIEIDWCGGIKTIYTNCGKLSPEHITELYHFTPFQTEDKDAEIASREGEILELRFINETQAQKIRELMKECDTHLSSIKHLEDLITQRDQIIDSKNAILNEDSVDYVAWRLLDVLKRPGCDVCQVVVERNSVTIVTATTPPPKPL